MRTALRYGAQALLYAAFVAVIGYFSTSPPYEHLSPDEAVLKLSLTHAGARKEACHQRSAEELARLGVHAGIVDGTMFPARGLRFRR